MPPDTAAIIQDLTELIAAIDRRSPHLERRGESDIVNAARELRAQACSRIAELNDTVGAPTGGRPGATMHVR